MRAGHIAQLGIALVVVLAFAVPFLFWRGAPVMGIAALFVLAVARGAPALFDDGADTRRRPHPSAKLSLAIASGLSLAAAAPFAWASRSLLGSGLHADLSAVAPDVFEAPLLFAAAYLAATLAVAGRRKVPVETWARVASVSGRVALALVVVVIGVGLAKRAHHVDPDRLRTSGEEIARAERSAWAGQVRHVRSVGSVHVVAQEELTGDDAEGESERCLSLHVDDPASGESGELPCGDSVSHYPALHLWVVAHYARAKSDREYEEVFVGPTFEPHDGTFAAFARELAPPLRWSMMALAGVLIALASVAPRDRRLRARLAWREDWRDGVAVLVSPTAERAESYRDAAPAEGPAVVEGTREGVREELARLRLDRWMFAIAAVVLTGTPLFVAAGMGFLR